MDSNNAPETETLATIRRTNRVLAVLEILVTGLAVYGTNLNLKQLTRVEEALRGVKFPMPGMTIAAFQYSSLAIGFLIGLATVCAIASSRREGRWGTIYLNVASIVMALSWWAFQSTAFYLGTVTVVAAIGSGK